MPFPLASQYDSAGLRPLLPRLKRNLVVGSSQRIVGIRQSESGSNIFLDAPKRKYVNARRINATPKDAIIMT